MNISDRLRGSPVARWSLLALVVIGLELAAATVIHRRGVAEGRASEQEKQTKLALEDNAKQLRAVRAHNDSLKKVDSAASAIAATSRAASDNHRPTVDRLGARIHVGQVGDSLVVLERPAGGAHDSLPVLLPLPIASFIREAKVQLGLDATTIHDLTVSNAVKDARIETLERADSLNQVRDSLHVERERQLEKNVKAEGKRGFWRGLKTGVVVTVGLLTTLAVVLK